MNTQRSMVPKLWFVASVAARQRWAERGTIAAQASFYALVLFVFSRLWGAVLSDHGMPGVQSHQLVWYLAITEWIVLSQVPVHTEIEQEVRRGDLAYRLARPVPYLAFKLAEAWGQLAVRMLSLAPIGFGVAWLLTGQLPTHPALMVTVLLVGPVASTLSCLFITGIGLTALVLHECRPVYWVWQKSAFTLGGLFIPLSLYPSWLRSIAEATPFAAFLYGPGSIALGLDWTGVAGLVVTLLVWIAVVATLLVFMFRLLINRFELGGG